MSLIRCPACARLISTTFPMHNCLEPGQVRYSVHRKRTVRVSGANPEQVTRALSQEKKPTACEVYRWVGDSEAEPEVMRGDEWLARASESVT